MRKKDAIFYFRKSGAFIIAFLPVILAFAYYGSNKNFSHDDSFITYRYAFHLMEGHGLVFNLHEKYYGTTAAGYAAALGIAGKFVRIYHAGITMQHLSVFFSAISLCAISTCIIEISKGLNFYFIRLLAAAAFILTLFLMPAFNFVAGHETYPFLAVSLAVVLLASRGKMLLSGAAIAVGATFRPDAVLFIPIIAYAHIRFNSISIFNALRDKPLQLFVLGVTVVLLPWLLFLYLHFDRLTPGTMDAKKAQFFMGYWKIYNFKNLLAFTKGQFNSWALPLLSAGIVMAVIRQFTKHPRAFTNEADQKNIFIAFCWLLFLLLSVGFYLSIKVTFWQWYGVPVVFSLLLVAHTGLMVTLSKYTPPLLHARIFTVFILLTSIGLLFLVEGKLRYWAATPRINHHITAYIETADYLKELEPAGTSVQMAEPGAFGMRLGPLFLVIDELGLVTPGVGSAYLRGDKNYIQRQYRPKYIVCSWEGAYSACSKPEVISKYTMIGEFDKGFWLPRIGRGAKLYRLNETE